MLHTLPFTPHLVIYTNIPSANFDLLSSSLHLNTHYISEGGTCGVDSFKICENAHANNYYVIPSRKMSDDQGKYPTAAYPSTYALSTGDEVDNKRDDVQVSWGYSVQRRMWCVT